MGTGGPIRSLWAGRVSQLGRGCGGATGSLQGDTNNGEGLALHSPLISLLLFLSSTVASPQIFTGSTDIVFPLLAIFPLLLPHRHI